MAGKVDLNGAALDLSGTTLPGTVGQTFTIVANDGNDAIMNTFANLPEGASLAWPGSTSFNARISYHGGDGNDVVLTLVSALTVTNTADSGAASLRGVLAYAASHAGADTIIFDSSLNGATIPFFGEIGINDPASVTIDASALPAGIILNGGGANRLFTIYSTSVFTGLTLSGGSTVANLGGAIINNGNLTLDRCTLSNNSSTYGGAIYNGHLATLTLMRCTFASNSATDFGGVIYNDSVAHLLRCTLANNSAFTGGAIYSSSGSFDLTHCTLSRNGASSFSFGGGVVSRNTASTYTNCIVAGNSGGNSGGMDIGDNGGSITMHGQNIIQSLSSFSSTQSFDAPPINADPLLAPLGNYGGPTKTMALLLGSPARNSATVLSPALTSDQRGFSITDSQPDIGAYEAGTLSNFNAWSYETLPATATDAQRAMTFDLDLDGRTNFLEYATLTDGGTANGGAILNLSLNTARTQSTFIMPYRAGATDVLYTVERTTNLASGPWTAIVIANPAINSISSGSGVTPIDGNSTSLTFTDSFVNGQPKVFYRLKVAPQ